MWSRALDRTFAVLLVALLASAAPALAALGDGAPAFEPTAGAPAGSGDGPESSVSLLPTALNAREIVADPENDVTIIGQEDPSPSSEHRDAIDIVSLTLAETDTAFLFSLKHRGYPDSQGTTSTFTISDAYCTIEWHVNGDTEVQWELSLNYLRPFDNDPWNIYSDLAWTRSTNQSFDYEHIGRMESALVADDHIEAIVPKEILTTGEQAATLQVGDRLDGFDVSCSRNTGTFIFRFYDEAVPDAKTTYPIAIASRTKEIELSFPEEEVHAIAVPVGKTQKVSVVVTSLVERKLLVNLTASVIDDQGQPMKGWKVTAAPTLELPPGGSLPASIIIAVEEGVQHRSGGILKLVAFPLGYEEKATFTARAYATSPPTTEQNTLYFHRAPIEGYWCQSWLCIGSMDDLPVQTADPQPDFFYLNVLEEDPEFSSEDGEDDGISMISTDETFAYLDTPLGNALRLDTEGFIDLTFSLKSEVARSLRMYTNVWSSDESLAYAETNVDITQDFQTHTLSLPVRSETGDVPKDSYIGISVSFAEDTGFGSFNGGTWISSVEWRPSESSMTLPLIARPESKVNITDGRALPTIVISNTTDRQEYINPESTQSFNLLLLNEGTQSDVVRLTTEASSPGWAFTFDPGNQFKLEPGTAAPLCVAVTAPEDVEEGDVVNITLIATSKLDAAVRTEIELSLIVTGFPLDAEGCREISEAEYVPPITDSEDSPVVAPAALLAIVAISLYAARRRMA